jgi:hypothetical protein
MKVKLYKNVENVVQWIDEYLNEEEVKKVSFLREQQTASQPGLPDFSWYNIQKGKNIPKWP